MYLFFIRIVFLSIFFNSAFAQEKLIFAIDVIRHGDRTPITDIPNAPYHWEERGYGQLTPIGMQQEFKLGERLRKIYIDIYHLLPPNYDGKTIYVRSSDMDRTLMSAQSLLIGLYPLGKGPKLPGSHRAALPHAFQPIPIHTVENDKDSLLVVSKKNPLFKKYMERYIYSTPEWKKKTAELQPKFEQWSKILGISITDLLKLHSVADTLYIDKLYHIPFPPELSKADADLIMNTGRWVPVTIFKSLEIGKESGRDLLNAIISFLEQASNKSTQLKYVLFSAHDSTQLSLMSAMKAPLDEPPPYASDLNISLFEKDKKYFVKIKFNNKAVKIPGCNNEVCTLEQFKLLARTVSQ